MIKVVLYVHKNYYEHRFLAISFKLKRPTIMKKFGKFDDFLMFK